MKNLYKNQVEMVGNSQRFIAQSGGGEVPNIGEALEDPQTLHKMPEAIKVQKLAVENPVVAKYLRQVLEEDVVNFDKNEIKGVDTERLSEFLNTVAEKVAIIKSPGFTQVSAENPRAVNDMIQVLSAFPPDVSLLVFNHVSEMDNPGQLNTLAQVIAKIPRASRNTETIREKVALINGQFNEQVSTNADMAATLPAHINEAIAKRTDLTSTQQNALAQVVSPILAKMQAVEATYGGGETARQNYTYKHHSTFLVDLLDADPQNSLDKSAEKRLTSEYGVASSVILALKGGVEPAGVKKDPDKTNELTPEEKKQQEDIRVMTALVNAMEEMGEGAGYLSAVRESLGSGNYDEARSLVSELFEKHFHSAWDTMDFVQGRLQVESGKSYMEVDGSEVSQMRDMTLEDILDSPQRADHLAQALRHIQAIKALKKAAVQSMEDTNEGLPEAVEANQLAIDKKVADVLQSKTYQEAALEEAWKQIQSLEQSDPMAAAGLKGEDGLPSFDFVMSIETDMALHKEMSQALKDGTDLGPMGEAFDNMVGVTKMRDSAAYAIQDVAYFVASIPAGGVVLSALAKGGSMAFQGVKSAIASRKTSVLAKTKPVNSHGTVVNKDAFKQVKAEANPKPAQSSANQPKNSDMASYQARVKRKEDRLQNAQKRRAVRGEKQQARQEAQPISTAAPNAVSNTATKSVLERLSQAGNTARQAARSTANRAGERLGRMAGAVRQSVARHPRRVAAATAAAGLGVPSVAATADASEVATDGAAEQPREATDTSLEKLNAQISNIKGENFSIKELVGASSAKIVTRDSWGSLNIRTSPNVGPDNIDQSIRAGQTVEIAPASEQPENKSDDKNTWVAVKMKGQEETFYVAGEYLSLK
jgi:hypothetical protein